MDGSPTPIDRRQLIKHLGGAGVAVGLAGCSIQEDPSPTDAGSGGDSSGDSSGGDSSGGDSSDEETETEQPAGTATAWYQLSDSEVPAREEIISAFNEESRHTVEGSDISDLQQKTSSAIPAGEGPEIFDWAHDWAGNSYEQGFIVDQRDQVSVDLERFTPAAQEAVQFDGNLIGLPYAAETITPIVNTDIVDTVPGSVSEMVDLMEQHHDPDNGQFGLAYPVNPYFASAWLQAFGGYFFDPDASPELGVNQDEFVQGLEFFMQNFRPYMPNDPGYSPQAATFAEGNAAFTMNGPWSLAGIQDNDVSHEIVSFPEMDGGTPSPFTGIQTWYFAAPMDEGGPNTTAALDFVEWFVTNEDHLSSLAQEQGSIPVLDTLVGSDDLPEQVQAFSGSAEQGIPMPSAPRMGDVWGPVGTALVKAFNGDASPQDALDQAAQEIRSNWE